MKFVREKGKKNLLERLLNVTIDSLIHQIKMIVEKQDYGGVTVKVSGNTFPVKEQLKKMGFYWTGSEWEKEDCNAECLNKFHETFPDAPFEARWFEQPIKSWDELIEAAKQIKKYKIEVRLKPNKHFALETFGKTYEIKEKLKQLGFKWNGVRFEIADADFSTVEKIYNNLKEQVHFWFVLGPYGPKSATGDWEEFKKEVGIIS